MWNHIYGSRSVYPGLKCQAYKSTNKCQIAATNCKTMQNVTLVLHDDSDTTSWYKPCEIFNPCETIWLYKICVKKCEMWFSVHITLIANTGRVSSLNSEKLRLCLWCQSPENTDKKYTFSFVNHRNVLNWIWRSQVNIVFNERKTLLGNICIFYLRNICIFYCRKSLNFMV